MGGSVPQAERHWCYGTRQPLPARHPGVPTALAIPVLHTREPKAITAEKKELLRVGISWCKQYRVRAGVSSRSPGLGQHHTQENNSEVLGGRDWARMGIMVWSRKKVMSGQQVPETLAWC